MRTSHYCKIDIYKDAFAARGNMTTLSRSAVTRTAPLICVRIQNWSFDFDCESNSGKNKLPPSRENQQTLMEDPILGQFKSSFFHVTLPSNLRSPKLSLPLIS